MTAFTCVPHKCLSRAPNSTFSQNKPNIIRQNISVSCLVFVCSSYCHILSTLGVSKQLFPYCQPRCSPQGSLCGRSRKPSLFRDRKLTNQFGTYCLLTSHGAWEGARAWLSFYPDIWTAPATLTSRTRARQHRETGWSCHGLGKVLIPQSSLTHKADSEKIPGPLSLEPLFLPIQTYSFPTPSIIYPKARLCLCQLCSNQNTLCFNNLWTSLRILFIQSWNHT